MRVGPYILEDEIGRGGMAVVHRARTPDGRVVALKLLQTRGDLAARFEREKRLLASFDAASGFVPLLDAGDSPQGPWIAMPYLPGGSLRDRLEAGPLSLEAATDLARRVARALAAAHARGVVHRDLKPENVLYDDEDLPLVADLGLAKHFDAAAPGASQSIGLSRPGELRGTIGYMPPEQAQNARAAGPAADVFAFGAVLHEALAGEPAFPGSNAVEVLTRTLAHPPPPLRSLRHEVSPALEALVARCLATDPARRFADGGELLAALEASLGAPGSRRPSAVGLALAAVALVALGGAGAAAVVSRAPEPAASPSPARSGSPSPAPSPGATPAAARALPGAAVKPWWEPSPLQLACSRETRLPLALETKKHRIRLALVPGGKFLMGSPTTEPLRDDDETEHEVELTGPVYFAATEVPNALFRRFAPRHRSGTFVERSLEGDDQPAMAVGFREAVAFCAWLAREEEAEVRLPTEAEWERACRAGTRTVRFWGDGEREAGLYANVADRRVKDAAMLGIKIWDTDDGFEATSPVGRFRPNAFGLHDMIGNAWEWCSDGYGPYSSSARDPVGKPSTAFHVIRGGSCMDGPDLGRSACRRRARVDVLDPGVGIRLVFAVH